MKKPANLFTPFLFAIAASALLSIGTIRGDVLPDDAYDDSTPLVENLCMTSDGNSVILARYEGFMVWNYRTSTIRHYKADTIDTVDAMAIASSRNEIYTGCFMARNGPGCLIRWNASTFDHPEMFAGKNISVKNMSLSANQHVLLTEGFIDQAAATDENSGGGTSQQRLWRLSDRKCILQTHFATLGAVAEPDGLGYVGALYNSIFRVRIGHKEKETLFRESDNIHEPAFSPNADKVAYTTSNYPSVVVIRNLRTGTAVRQQVMSKRPQKFWTYKNPRNGTIDHGPIRTGPDLQFAYSRKGNYVMCYGSKDRDVQEGWRWPSGFVAILDSRNGHVIALHKTPRPIWHVDSSPDEKVFAACGTRGLVYVWDLKKQLAAIDCETPTQLNPK